MWNRSTSFIGLSVGVLVMALSLEAAAQGAPPPPPPGTEPAPAPAPAPPPEGAPPPAAPAPAAPPPGAAPPPAQGGYAAQVGAAPPPADAEGVHTHDGFYLRLALGFGSLSGTVKQSSAGFDAPDTDASGGGVASEFALGGTLAPGLVLGGGLYGVSVPTPSYEPDGGTSADGDSLVLSSIGPFIDYYFDPNGGGHIQASIALAVASQAKGDLSSAYSGTGYALMFGGGYEWWIGEQWSLGVLARVQYFNVNGHPDDDIGGLSADDIDVEASFLVPALLLSVTLH